MNYREYNIEYQKVVIKQQLKKELHIKKVLVEMIKDVDKKEVLETFLESNDFEEQLEHNKKLAELFKDDSEGKEVVNGNYKLIMELKEKIENRLQELSEQENQQENEEENEQEQVEKKKQLKIKNIKK